ncbi:MAG: FAD-binding oxidoreductase, partial [Alphaproteobacteria bacterium]|nr:FAD-binding oxidoreductase [Alphaproteobacteria bacterium]
MSVEALAGLAARLGPKGFTTDAEVMAPWLTDWRGIWHGEAAALVSPETVAEVADVVRTVVAASI